MAVLREERKVTRVVGDKRTTAVAREMNYRS